MTKADLIAKISDETGLERNEVSRTVESMMESIKSSLTNGQNVYLRGFGSFVVRERKQKNRSKHFKEYNDNYPRPQYSFV